MSVSPILSAPDPAHPLTDAAFAGQFHRVAEAAVRVDGYAPFNEQALFDLNAGKRTAWLITAGDAGETVSTSPTLVSTSSTSSTGVDGAPGPAADIVGAAILGRGELDLVIDPARRREGHGSAAFAELAAMAPEGVTLWSHGDHPAARVLAARFGFVAERTLLQLRMPLNDAVTGVTAGITTFRPGIDDAEWVALNALVFAGHPEQGALTVADLSARQAEHWFDAGDFLVARDPGGRMIGYNWLKIEGEQGEIYVIGVHPDAAGQGLGRALMTAGLNRLRERGCTRAELYVEAESRGAVHLYRSLGFTDFTVDVQYRRLDRARREQPR